ncbi:MAG: BspA family leucine-rich repeat surface protein, partial [Prevotella sp.]|nr:BspA family leucine-rich repeat surface protein [Prevotella sp.]
MKQRQLLKTLFSLVVLLLCAVTLHAQEPYAVLSDDNTVLTFYYDTQKAERGGMSVGPFKKNTVSWYGQHSTITTVVFDPSFANCTSLTSTACWFYGCSMLTTITGIENLKTDNLTDMNRMFYKCSGLTSLDVGDFKTDNVTDMSLMFYDCSGLTSLDVSGFRTDNVKDMGWMFSGCSGLSSLDLSNFKTDNVTNMTAMFQKCSGLTSLDVSGFRTDNVKDMGWMFSGCSGLSSLDLSNFKTDNV